jgi:hypothetical protein
MTDKVSEVLLASAPISGISPQLPGSQRTKCDAAGWASPPTLLSSVSPIADKTERPPFWHNWDDRGGSAGGAEHSQNTTSRMHLKMAEVLGTVLTGGREVFRRWLESQLLSQLVREPLGCSRGELLLLDGSWSRGQFGNRDEWEHPALQAATKQRQWRRRCGHQRLRIIVNCKV